MQPFLSQLSLMFSFDYDKRAEEFYMRVNSSWQAVDVVGIVFVRINVQMTSRRYSQDHVVELYLELCISA